jgi:hypothetical protein
MLKFRRLLQLFVAGAAFGTLMATASTAGSAGAGSPAGGGA